MRQLIDLLCTAHIKRRPIGSKSIEDKRINAGARLLGGSRGSAYLLRRSFSPLCRIVPVFILGDSPVYVLEMDLSPHSEDQNPSKIRGMSSLIPYLF